MEEIVSLFSLAILLLFHAAQGFRLGGKGALPLPETNSIGGAGLADLALLGKGGEDLPDEIIAHKGGRLVLSCEAGGSPSPTIHWLKNGVRLEQNDNNRIEDEEAFYENNPHNEGMPTLRIGSTKSRLFIDCVTEADAGEYSCVADEPTKRIAKVTNVKVELSFGADDVLLSCLNKRQDGAYTPARVYMWTAHRLEIEGADVQLFCRAAGNPAPAISWVQVDKEDNELPLNSDQYELLANGDLFIHEIAFINNMGTYKCIAENVHGKDEADSFLYPTSFGRK